MLIHCARDWDISMDIRDLYYIIFIRHVNPYHYNEDPKIYEDILDIVLVYLLEEKQNNIHYKRIKDIS